MDETELSSSLRKGLVNSILWEEDSLFDPFYIELNDLPLFLLTSYVLSLVKMLFSFI